MKVTVIPGATYAITTAAECTVTTTEGVLIATCPAGEQSIIVAPTAEIVVSDDSAIVTESFKAASLGSSAQGGCIKNGQDATLNKLKAAAIDCEGPATFSGGVTMAGVLDSTSTIRCKSLSVNDAKLVLAYLGDDAFIQLRPPYKLSISTSVTTTPISFELLKSGMRTYASMTKLMAGDIGLTGNSLLNMTEGDARWLKVRADLSDAEYAALEEKDATTLYITTDGKKVYVGTLALN